MTPAEAYEVYSRDPKATASVQTVRNALSRLRHRGLVSKDADGKYAVMAKTPELAELRVGVAKKSLDVSSPEVSDVRGNPTRATQGVNTKRRPTRSRR